MKQGGGEIRVEEGQGGKSESNVLQAAVITWCVEGQETWLGIQLLVMRQQLPAL